MCIRDSDHPIKPAISHKEAIQSLTTAKKWYKGQNKAELSKIILLHQIHNLALEKYSQLKKKKQENYRFFCG